MRKIRNIILGLLCLGSVASSAQESRVYLDFNVGLHAFFLPGIGARFKGVQPQVSIGLYQRLGKKQVFSSGITLGYQRHRYQGDAFFTQAQFRYHPQILHHFEPEIATGIGYQWSTTPGRSLELHDGEWAYTQHWKGTLQMPVRIALAYRHNTSARVIPYVSYQANVLFGYSPDLSPLPVSAFMGGFKYVPRPHKS